MSERYKPKNLIRERIIKGPSEIAPVAKPQIEWRNGKPFIKTALLCRLHNEPWMTCKLCSKTKR